jgi:hypothetical protein
VQSTVDALRACLARHNRRVGALTVLTLTVAAGLWFVLYACFYWLTLLALTATRGLEARLPEAFPAVFLYIAGMLVAFAYLLRRVSPDEMPRDEKTWFEQVTDVLLAVPRATLAVWGNLSAWQGLSESELAMAGQLIDRISAEGRVPLHTVPLDIPDRAARKKVLVALQLSEIVEVRRFEGAVWLSLSPANQLALPS